VEQESSLIKQLEQLKEVAKRYAEEKGLS